MYYADYHTHTRLSPDSSTLLRDMAEAAVKAGLSELCVTDHYDLVDQDGTPIEAPLDWAPALQQLEEVRKVFQDKLMLRLGLEFGSATLSEDISARTLDQPLLDFVIGSLHNLSPEAGGTDFYFIPYRTPASCYTALDDYFSHMARLAPLPWYDCLGHIIYPLRYMCLRDGQTVTLNRYTEQIRNILKTVIQTGRGIEVNTYNGRTIEDWKSVLHLYKELGGEILTVGSDAHQPENIGRGIREAYDLVSAMGFRYIAIYRNRKPEFIKL